MTNEIFIPSGNTYLINPWNLADFDTLIRIENFYIDEHPVTYSQVKQYILATGKSFPVSCWREVGIFRKDHIPQSGDLNDPIIGMTWIEANTFTKWNGRRLPTWIELLRAARGYNEERPTHQWDYDNPAIVYKRIFPQIHFSDMAEWTNRVGLNYIDERWSDQKPIFFAAPFTSDSEEMLKERKIVHHMLNFLPPDIVSGIVGFRTARNA